jgi:hypothetical protein
MVRSHVSVMGIMTDTDDTGREATACCGDIAFHPLHHDTP